MSNTDEYSAEYIINQLKDDYAYMRRLYKEYKEMNEQLHEENLELKRQLREKEKPVVAKSSYVRTSNVTPISEYGKKPYVKRNFKDFSEAEKQAWFESKGKTYIPRDEYIAALKKADLRPSTSVDENERSKYGSDLD